MITIAFCNSKGGTGKTTLTAAMAVEAANDSYRLGKKQVEYLVALVDLDPQRSLTKWWEARGRLENPFLVEGINSVQDAVDKLDYMEADLVMIDSPPAFIPTIESCIDAADFVVMPLRASMLDVAASEDAVVLANDYEKPLLLVLNDVHKKEGVVGATAEWLGEQGIAVAEVEVEHRVSHTYAMMEGLTAREKINGRFDKAATAELAELWAEILSDMQEAGIDVGDRP
ncbi:MAG: ParA family protein [Pseudomonadota bacterium]